MARGKQRGDMRGQRESGAKSPKSKSGVHGRQAKKAAGKSKKAAGKSDKRPAEAAAQASVPTARGKKKECKEQVVSEMDQIVAGLIRKAKQGSVSHAKFLLDFAEEEPGAEAATDESGKDAAGESLAEVLLQRLDGEAADAAAPSCSAGRPENASRKTVISK